MYNNKLKVLKMDLMNINYFQKYQSFLQLNVIKCKIFFGIKLMNQNFPFKYFYDINERVLMSSVHRKVIR